MVGLETVLAMVLNGSIPADDGIRGGVGDEVERGSFLSTMLRVIFLIFIQHGVSQMGTLVGVPGVIL